MNLPSIIILVIALLIICGIIIFIIRDRIKGKSGCSCCTSSSNCPYKNCEKGKNVEK